MGIFKIGSSNLINDHDLLVLLFYELHQIYLILYFNMVFVYGFIELFTCCYEEYLHTRSFIKLLSYIRSS